MNSQEKVEFIQGFMDMIKKDLVSKVPVMPEDWDGIQLRNLIADAFTYEAGGKASMDIHTFKAYKKTCRDLNL